MCQNKTTLLSVCLILLLTASFCLYQVYPEKKVGQHSEIRNKFLAKTSARTLNVFKCFYLVDEEIVGCNCTCLDGGKPCEKYIWLT